MKKRSVAGCLKATMQTVTMNFATIFRNTYLPAIACAVVGMLMSLVQLKSAMSGELVPSMWQSVAFFLLGVLLIVANAWLRGNAISLVNDHGMKANRKRSMKFACFELLAMLLFSVVSVIVAGLVMMLLMRKGLPVNIVSLAAFGTYMGVTLLLALAYVPFAYSEMKYLNNDGATPFGLIFTSYRCGLRHYGYLLGLSLLAGFIFLLLVCIAALPIIIISVAAAINSMGVAAGDATGLPGSFVWIVAVATFVDFFLLSLATLWLTYNYFFAFTSIEVKEKERRELKETEAAGEEAKS